MINKEMYLVQDRVWYSDVNLKGELSVPALMDHFQNLSYASAADLGHSVEKLSKIDKAWFVAAWNIYVYRYPKLDEKITIGTAPYSFKGILGYRNCCLWDENEELLAIADAQWFWFDTKAGKPTRPDPSDTLGLYKVIEPIEMEHEPRKIHLPDEMERRSEFTVDYRKVDTNHHVNNSRYVDMALDVLGEYVCPGHIRVEYIRAAALGDTVIPFVGKRDGRTVVSLAAPDGPAYATVEFEAKPECMNLGK